MRSFDTFVTDSANMHSSIQLAADLQHPISTIASMQTLGRYRGYQGLTESATFLSLWLSEQQCSRSPLSSVDHAEKSAPENFTNENTVEPGSLIINSLLINYLL